MAADFGANTASLTSAMTYVVQTYENLYSNPIVVNIDVAASPGTSILSGNFTPVLGPYTYSQVHNALIANATNNPNDAMKQTSIANLPAADPSGGQVIMSLLQKARHWGWSQAIPLLQPGRSRSGPATTSRSIPTIARSPAILISSARRTRSFGSHGRIAGLGKQLWRRGSGTTCPTTCSASTRALQPGT